MMEAAVVTLGIAVAIQALALSFVMPFLLWKLITIERLMWLRIGSRVRNLEKDVGEVDKVVTGHLSNFYGNVDKET
jgi:hypothetical protein